MHTTHLAITLLFHLETGSAQIFELKIAGVLLLNNLILAIKKAGGTLRNEGSMPTRESRLHTLTACNSLLQQTCDTFIILNRNQIQPAIHLPNLANQH